VTVSRPGKGTVVLLGICRFNGCDAAATATVGTLSLCALHQSYVLELMDGRLDQASENDSAVTNDFWSHLSVGELET
jgi:hypothetical protein